MEIKQKFNEIINSNIVTEEVWNYATKTLPFAIPALLVFFLIFDGLFLYQANVEKKESIRDYCQLAIKAQEVQPSTNCYIEEMVLQCTTKKLIKQHIEQLSGKTYTEKALQRCSEIHGEVK